MQAKEENARLLGILHTIRNFKVDRTGDKPGSEPDEFFYNRENTRLRQDISILLWKINRALDVSDAEREET